MRISLCFLLLLGTTVSLSAQQPPYDIFPDADPPYYRVRYAAPPSPKDGELIFPVNYTVWIPEGVKALRGVIVHQHGCGEGSCKSGLTGAFDLHWQALAKKHGCALLGPSYEQPQEADCQMWCDPRNGSDGAFQKSLIDLGEKSGHPELDSVPWALWGHSGGGHWAGGMTLLHPERVAAAWLRSGVPVVEPNPERATIQPYVLADDHAALNVPIMCNPGTKEGVTEKEGRFAGVWPSNETFLTAMRSRGALIGVAIDPLTAHECGNQRYLAIPWLDACLRARLPEKAGDPLKKMPVAGAWLADGFLGKKALPAAEFKADPGSSIWLPNELIAKAWMSYVEDANIADSTPPPAPTDVQVEVNEITWKSEADLESGIARFLIERDGEQIAAVPDKDKNPFGRPIFQGLQYSDTPQQPLAEMRFTDTTAKAGDKHEYRIISVNTAGLRSN